MACTPCPSNAECEGGNMIYLNPGYWRISVNSDLIYQCKNAKACLGGYESLCQSGFEGILCNTCIFNTTDRFFKNFNNLCYQCENEYSSYIIVFGIFMLLIFYQTLTIKIKMKSKNYVKSSIMKILLNYLQLMNVINNFDIDIPSNISSIFTFQSSANNPKQALFPLNCIFNSSENLFVLNCIFVCSFSIFYPILVGLFLLIKGYCKKTKKSDFKYMLVVSVLIVCYTLQSFFLNFFLGAFNCETFNGKSYLNDFLTQECWTPYHLSILYYLIIPFLLLWAFFLPLWTFYVMKKHKSFSKISNVNTLSPSSLISNNFLQVSFKNERRNSPIKSSLKKENLKTTSEQHDLDSNKVLNPYSFITDGYKTEKYYWEFVVLIQKILVIISITFVHDTNGLLCLFLFLYFLFIIIQLLMEPFNEKNIKNESLYLNSLQLYGYFTNFLIVFFCLCLKFQVDEWETLFYLMLIIIANMLFLLYWGLVYLKESKETFKKIINFFETKCPRLWRAIKSLFYDIYDRTVSPKYGKSKNKGKALPKAKEFIKTFNG